MGENLAREQNLGDACEGQRLLCRPNRHLQLPHRGAVLQDIRQCRAASLGLEAGRMGRADEEAHRFGRAEDFTRRGKLGIRGDFRPQLQGSTVFRGRNPRPAAAHRGRKRQEIRHLHRRVPKRGQLRRFAGVSA